MPQSSEEAQHYPSTVSYERSALIALYHLSQLQNPPEVEVQLRHCCVQ